MCDTFVALPAATGDSSVVFGKNSDREPNEAQILEYYEPASYPPRSHVRCTYVEIPQVRHTQGVLISRPFWMWGAEMGVNDRGVVIGNEAVFTRMPREKQGRLLGMDLLRLALERSVSAASAVATIIELLAEHGQGGAAGYQNKNFVYHNSYLVADLREAWVLETAGPLWASRRVRGFYSISNGLTIGEEFEEFHPELISEARRRGWLKARRTFHFARCYTDRDCHTASACIRRRRSEALLNQLCGRMVVSDAFAMLRDHGGTRTYRPDGHLLIDRLCVHAASGRFRHSAQTTASLVVQMTPGGLTCWATGTSAPCTSVFKPIWLADGVLPDRGPTPSGVFAPASLWWRHELLHRRIIQDFQTLSARGEDSRRQLEAELLERSRSVDGGQRFGLTREAFERADQLEKAWLEEIAALPERRAARLSFRRYWKKQNSAAALQM